jgi:carboxymethylenebutenolidase
MVKQRADVIPDRIGLLGTSLGASLALSLAAMRSDIAAVAELFGALPRVVADLVKFLPPVLIVHGAEDRIVPVDQAHNLGRLLKQANIPYDIKIYPEEGHLFRPTAGRESAELTQMFFDKYLHADATDQPA